MATFTLTRKAKEDMLAIAQPCSEIRESYSKYLAGKHVIFYRYITLGQIEIVRILHGRMDISRLFNRNLLARENFKKLLISLTSKHSRVICNKKTHYP